MAADLRTEFPGYHYSVLKMEGQDKFGPTLTAWAVVLHAPARIVLG